MCSKQNWTRAYVPIFSIPLLLYASKMWVIMKKEEQSLVTTVLLYEHIWIEVIHKWNRMKNMITEYQKQTFYWASYVARFTDSRWTYAVVRWYLRDWNQPLGRPPQWREDEIKWFGSIWRRRARLRTKLKCIVISDVENISKPDQ